VNFADTLKTLPSIDHLEALELLDATGNLVARIDNQPGRKGSLAVYAALAARHDGRIGPVEAQEGLTLFAEHTSDAREHPGSHPNIDRLIDLIALDQTLRVRLVQRG